MNPCIWILTSQVVGGRERQNFSVILKTPPPPLAWGFWMPSKSRGSIVHSDLVRRQRSTSYLYVLLSFSTGTVFGIILCFAILLYGSSCSASTPCGSPWSAPEPISADQPSAHGFQCYADSTWWFYWHTGRCWLYYASTIWLCYALPHYDVGLRSGMFPRYVGYSRTLDSIDAPPSRHLMQCPSGGCQSSLQSCKGFSYEAVVNAWQHLGVADSWMIPWVICSNPQSSREPACWKRCGRAIWSFSFKCNFVVTVIVWRLAWPDL